MSDLREVGLGLTCPYCGPDHDNHGCDCGACGVVYPGSHGYAGCLRYNDCPACGCRRWGPWRLVWWRNAGLVLRARYNKYRHRHSTPYRTVNDAPDQPAPSATVPSEPHRQ